MHTQTDAIESTATTTATAKRRRTVNDEGVFACTNLVSWHDIK